MCVCFSVCNNQSWMSRYYFSVYFRLKCTRTHKGGVRAGGRKGVERNDTLTGAKRKKRRGPAGIFPHSTKLPAIIVIASKTTLTFCRVINSAPKNVYLLMEFALIFCVGSIRAPRSFFFFSRRFCWFFNCSCVYRSGHSVFFFWVKVGNAAFCFGGLEERVFFFFFLVGKGGGFLFFSSFGVFLK